MGEGTTDKRIIITGPESTGKSDLSVYLADRFKGKAIPEFARTYISELNRDYTYSDIEIIAREQYETWKSHEKSSHLVFFDTHLIITKIWFLWLYKKYPDWLDKAINETSTCLCLLCNYDIPWRPDPLRENGGEAREKLFYLYKSELEKNKINYHIIKGVGEERFKYARKVVQEKFEL